jgi:hypothetical protein
MAVHAKRASKEGVGALTRWIKIIRAISLVARIFFASANALSQIAFNFPDKLKLFPEDEKREDHQPRRPDWPRLANRPRVRSWRLCPKKGQPLMQ